MRNFHAFCCLMVMGLGQFAPVLAQRPGQTGRYLLSPFKPDTAQWAGRTFVSIEPSSSHVTACITLCQQAPDDKFPYTREGSRYTFYLPGPEFTAVERLVRYSLAKADNQFPVGGTDFCFEYQVYFHTPPLYTARWLDEKARLTAFYSSLLEEVACNEHGVSAPTQANLLPLLQAQLEYLSIEEKWRKSQADGRSHKQKKRASKQAARARESKIEGSFY